MGIIMEHFHCVGKYPRLRHSNLGKEIRKAPENLQKYVAGQTILARCFARVELFQHDQNGLFRKFFIVDRVQRFNRLLSDAFVMYSVGTLAVFGYKMFLHLVECALYVV